MPLHSFLAAQVIYTSTVNAAAPTLTWREIKNNQLDSKVNTVVLAAKAGTFVPLKKAQF